MRAIEAQEMREGMVTLGGIVLALVLLVLTDRALSHTIDGTDLLWPLVTCGGVAGLAAGVWHRARTRTAWAKQREDQRPTTPQSSVWTGECDWVLLFVCAVIGALCMSLAGGLSNRLINVGFLKVEPALIVAMPASIGKGATYRLRLEMPERGRTVEIKVTPNQYQTFRMLDTVEVHTKRGVLGYDYVTDIVKVGSQRVGQ